MELLRKPRLLDERGNPLSDRIETVLTRLLPRFQRQFPALQDEVAITEVLEEAGRRIANREQRAGPIEKLHGYAWVTLRSVATSWMRRGSSRLAGKTLPSDESRAALNAVPAESGTPEEMERAILLRELLARLTPEERYVCVRKKDGYSSQEIARRCGSTVAAVDTLFSRTKQKMRRLSSVQEGEASRHEPMTSPGGKLRERPAPNEKDAETSDDEPTPAASSGL